MENALLAGYSRQVITPDYQVHLAGYGDDERRLSEGVADDICVTCIAITSGEETILLYTSDLLSTHQKATDWIREEVCPVTGIPADHIFSSGTHSHNGPSLYDNFAPTKIFRATFLKAVVTAAQEALADRSEAKLYAGMKELPGLNFTRHYIMEDGSVSGSNFGNWKLKCVGHALATDPRMILLRFVRESKPDIVMMNWQAHNDTVKETGYNLVSAGYVTHIRNQFEADTGMHFAFFQGCSGNQAKISRIEEENHGLNWIDYGHRLAKEAQAMFEILTPVQGTAIKTLQDTYDAQIDHSWDHMIEQANEVFNLWKTVGKPEGDALGKTYGFTSSYQARDIRIRYAMDKTMPFELNAFSIGDLAFMTSYNEVFSTVGLHVRANAPFEKVFFVTGNSRYLPCKEAYDYRSYEADTSIFARGTAEGVQEKMVQMLKAIK